MLRFLMVLAVAGTIMAGAFTSAAGLIVDGNIVQAGADNELRCDVDGVEVWSWAINDNRPDALEGVDTVKIRGVDAACAGARMFARITLTADRYVYTTGTPGVLGDPNWNWVVASSAGNDYIYSFFLVGDDRKTPVTVPAEDVLGLKVWFEGNQP